MHLIYYKLILYNIRPRLKARPNTITLGRALKARPKVSSEAAFKARPKGALRPRFCRGYRPGLGPRFKKCGLRLHGPIVARFRPRKETRPNKPRPKAQRALGRVFCSYGRVFKTRPQKHFFVVYTCSFYWLLNLCRK